jgi:hypothetical protein
VHKTSSTRGQIPNIKKYSRNLSAALVLLACTAGCTHVNDWLRGERGAQEETYGIDGSDLAPYIGEMSQLASGDPATQAEIYADAAAAARLTPDTGSRLRFALVLATPGHPGADPDLAQNILRDLLSQTELLTPVERSLATIHLHEVEERLTLNAEARRLRLASVRQDDVEDAAAAQRIASVESENRQLRQSLAEAEEKLNAITSIERSIREQADAAGQQ